MRNDRRSKPPYQTSIAKERIEILFKEAEMRAKKDDYGLQRRYVRLAKRIGMRYNVKISPYLKRKYCKYCYTFLFPKSKVRLEKGMVTIKCFNCGKKIRYPYR
ncbi:MAG: hypothetical protein QMD85_03985 [Candidatus Aenigmarchaeota archaeon]|nr:hypothetical protein [Candidatus Aenigmarchaeota archaeon]MDI6722722.1 hypothetical protein [Candidatus Aenigmarchaeota archaeon]